MKIQITGSTPRIVLCNEAFQMAINENYSDIAAGKGRQQSLSVLHPIHEAAMRIADLGLNRSRHKTAISSTFSCPTALAPGAATSRRRKFISTSLRNPVAAPFICACVKTFSANKKALRNIGFAGLLFCRRSQLTKAAGR